MHKKYWDLLELQTAPFPHCLFVDLLSVLSGVTTYSYSQYFSNFRIIFETMAIFKENGTMFDGWSLV